MARNMVRLRTSMYWILKISHFFQGIPTESKMGSSPHPVAGVVSWGDPMRVAEMLDVQETRRGLETFGEPALHHGSSMLAYPMENGP